MKDGDAGTKNFHAHATIRHRKNNITTLKDTMGNAFHGHEPKAELLWNSFKDRMGQSEFNQMIFSLDQFLQPAEGLENLEMPFSKNEIDTVVANLRNNKSQGLDGYSNEFIKGCSYSTWLLQTM